MTAADALSTSNIGGNSILTASDGTASERRSVSEDSSRRSLSPSTEKAGSEPSEQVPQQEVESLLGSVERVIPGKGYAKSSWRDLPEGLRSAITKSAVPNTDAHPGLKPAVTETRHSTTDAQHREQSPDEQVQLPIMLGPDTGYIRREVPPKGASASTGSIHYIMFAAIYPNRTLSDVSRQAPSSKSLLRITADSKCSKRLCSLQEGPSRWPVADCRRA